MGPPPRLSHLPTPPVAGGRYAELSARHLSARTAVLLDEWAGPHGAQAPVLVAANMAGWFVATEPLGTVAAPVLPEDLCAALDFGRLRGFDFIFFHCDAPVVAELGIAAW